MAERRARCLLLQRTPWSESSLVVRALSADDGPLRLVARGAYRATSRYFCVLDLFDTLELSWRPGRGDGLSNLTEGRVLVRRRHLPTCFDSYEAALTLLELADLVARPGHAEAPLFRLLEAGLDALERGAAGAGLADGPAPRPSLELARFELRLLDQLGLAPALEGCATCGRPAPADLPGDRTAGARVPFSAGAGGRLCRPCAEEARRSGLRVGTLPDGVLRAAHSLIGGGPEPDEALVPRLRDLSGRFLEYHLETSPRSHRRFLAAPDRNAKLRRP